MTFEEIAPIILELDRLQEEQLKADTLAHFATQNAGRFASLNAQKYRDTSARRQERQIELQRQLEVTGYDYRPLRFALEFYITPFYSERELARYGNPGQKYCVTPAMESITDQQGCKHTVQAATLLEGSSKALAEHKTTCLNK